MSGVILLVIRLALTASLLVFIGWALYLVWNDVRLQAGLVAARRIPPLKLRIQVKDEPPITRDYSQNDITIGRDPNCECPLPGETVSARHARLSYHHGQWWLEDLRSTNGTRLNDERLTTPTVIISGDRIKCGDALLVVGLAEHLPLSPTLRLQDDQEHEHG